MDKRNQILERIKKIKSKDKPANFSSDFYAEVDNKKSNNSLVVWTIVMIMVTIFISLITGYWYIKKYFSQIHIKTNTPSVSISNENSFINHLKSDINKQQSGKNITISYSEGDLENMLGISGGDFPLKKSSLNITQRGVEISGRTSQSPFSFPVNIIMKPVVEDAKMSFVFEEIKSGFVSLPSTLKKQLNSYVDNSINNKLSAIDNFEFTSAITRPGFLDISGVVRGN